jgi:hypothetical protein
MKPILLGTLRGKASVQLSDLPFLSPELIEFSITEDVEGWLVGSPIVIQLHGDEYLIRQGDTVAVAHAPSHRARVELQVQRGLTQWVLRHHQGHSLRVQWLDLVEELQLDLSISVDEAIAEQLAGKGEIPSANDLQQTIIWLQDHFVSPVLTNDGLNAELGQVYIGRFDNAIDDGFLLFGKGWRAAVKRHQGALKLFRLTRITGRSVRLASATGKISFLDWTVRALLQSEEQRALLDAARRDTNGGYLRLWQEYGKLEWQQAQACARELGSIRYKSAVQTEGEQWVWFLDIDNSDELKRFRDRWRTLELAGSSQVEVSERDLELDLEDGAIQESTEHMSSRPLRGTVRFERNGIVVIPSQDRRNEKPPSSGYIYYSLSGDETVQNRRERAKQSIDDGHRFEQLKYILDGVAPPSRRMKHINGLSPYAKLCFKGQPTERQEAALDVALNTPDIALIVGPPGTGKTQVIAALQRRLAETLGELALQHQVLISSFQHDAVDNALNRAEVFGLPAIRIGGRGRRDEGGVDSVKVWCDRKRKELTASLDRLQAEDPLAQVLTELSLRLATMRLARLSATERHEAIGQLEILLQRLSELSVRLTPELRDRWRDFFAAQSSIQVTRSRDQLPGLIRLARSQRVTPKSFADDGPDRAYQLQRALRRTKVSLSEAEEALLQDLTETTAPTIQQLTDFRVLRDVLIDKLLPDYRPPEIKQAMGVEVLALLTDIEKAIDEPLRNSRKGVYSAVSSYVSALSQSPDRAREAAWEYASIVGATCQQSAGNAMANLKSPTSLASIAGVAATDSIEFDTVIVDEAARANPLDLFVPMAMARRRIVLVGDHRQLPHLLQQDLENELVTRQNLSDIEKKAYEQSLFERLVEQLKRQEATDGVKRVVMLDTQFRMHPSLGRFISEQFYKSDDLELLPGRPATDFVHTLPGYQGKYCAWIDVLSDEGQENRRGTSRIRKAEAKAIAREVKRLADAGGSTMSIGVISFYRAQCDLILEEMEAVGLTERDDGELRIVRELRETNSGEERLRVGTVDAFQGKEFDVVLLSVVRSNEKVIPAQLSAEEKDPLLNAKYGHLRLANRMNVAMSRQRKLLIAVGDSHMASGKEAEEAVPALAAFLALCRGDSRGH